MVSILNALNGALKTNIFAVQQIQSQIDTVQQRLSSGQRVNSILDNPNSFILSSSLGSRSARLNTILDGIISKVTTVQQADDSVSSLTDLTNLLRGIGENAEQVLVDNPTKAEITGNRDLSSFTDLATELPGVDVNDAIYLNFVDTTGAIKGAKVALSPAVSTNDLIAGINAIVDSGANQVFDASLNGSGQLNITSRNNTRFELGFQTGGGVGDPQLVNALGFGDFETDELRNGIDETRITVSPTPSLTTVPLFDLLSGESATESSRLLVLSDSAAGPFLDVFNGDTLDTLGIGVNGESASTVIDNLRASTVKDFLDGINNSALGAKIQATLNSGTGAITIRAVDSDVESLQFEIRESNTAGILLSTLDLQDLGIGTRNLVASAEGNGQTSSESVQLGPGSGDLADLEVEYNTLRSQVDGLVDDSEFNNVNLLNGDNLIAALGESNSSLLTIEGANFKVANLGVNEANFANNTKITSALAEVDSALREIESFSNGLANDLQVLETRRDFTEDTIVTLNQGIDDLTTADQEEDSALLLALQARKDISITVLGLTSQSQASVLRTFTGFQNV